MYQDRNDYRRFTMADRAAPVRTRKTGQVGRFIDIAALVIASCSVVSIIAAYNL